MKCDECNREGGKLFEHKLRIHCHWCDQLAAWKNLAQHAEQHVAQLKLERDQLVNKLERLTKRHDDMRKNLQEVIEQGGARWALREDDEALANEK